jgi:F0F1-type ATP synthase membrane subunit c/vacuolar-type H+-ATPase subunit K
MCPRFKFTTKYFMLLQAAKYIGAGLATIGLAGAGVGIGTGARWKFYFSAY